VVQGRRRELKRKHGCERQQRDRQGPHVLSHEVRAVAQRMQADVAQRETAKQPRLRGADRQHSDEAAPGAEREDFKNREVAAELANPECKRREREQGAAHP